MRILVFTVLCVFGMSYASAQQPLGPVGCGFLAGSNPCLAPPSWSCECIPWVGDTCPDGTEGWDKCCIWGGHCANASLSSDWYLAPPGVPATLIYQKWEYCYFRYDCLSEYNYHHQGPCNQYYDCIVTDEDCTKPTGGTYLVFVASTTSCQN